MYWFGPPGLWAFNHDNITGNQDLIDIEFNVGFITILDSGYTSSIRYGNTLHKDHRLG